MKGSFSRRGFMGGLAGLAGLGVAGLPDIRWQMSGSKTPTGADVSQAVRVIGETPNDVVGVMVRQMSDDVFERARKEIAGRSLQVVDEDEDRVGSVVTIEHGAERALGQMNTSVSYGAVSLLKERFDLQRFRSATRTWVLGRMAAPGSLWNERCESFSDLLRDASVVGVPHLPLGLMFSANYVCTETGLVMRAVSDYEINADTYMMRWDVLYA